MREHHPVFYDEETNIWQVFRYADVQRVLTDHHIFSSEHIPFFSENPFLKETLITKDPPEHRKLRNLITTVFTPRALERLSTSLMRITQELLAAVLPSGRMDVVSDLSFPLPAKAIALLLGIPDEDWDIFRRWTFGPETTGGLQMSGEELLAKMSTLQEQLYGYFKDLLALRRRSPREDLISTLSMAEVDGERLSESELVQFCFLLLAAGQETTRNLISNAVYCVTEDPNLYAQLLQEPALMPSAIEGVLRYMPPIWFTLRRVKTATRLGGQSLPANALIQAWNASANYDTAVFAEPERLDIRREPNRHLTFGYAIHFCIGAPLARLEAGIALPMMLAQLQPLQRVADVPIIVRTGMVYAIPSLPATFTARP